MTISQHTCAHHQHSGFKKRHCVLLTGCSFFQLFGMYGTLHDSLSFTQPNVAFPLIILDLSNLFLEQGSHLSCQKEEEKDSNSNSATLSAERAAS